MAKPGIQMWTLLVLFFEMYMGQVHYMASVPGILESGSKNRFCLSLSQPSYPVLVKVILKGLDSQKILLRKGTSNGFHKCYQFLVPSVKAEEEQLFEVSVKGNNFYSREIKRVLIKNFQPKTFIQTDKPIYNQGQTVEFRVVTLGTNLKPVEGHDPHNNRIARWTNQTAAAGTILQLYYPLGNEAFEGYYRIIVQIGKNRVFHSFKVQKYGEFKLFLPFFIYDLPTFVQIQSPQKVTSKLILKVKHVNENNAEACQCCKMEVFCCSGASYTQWERTKITYLVGRLFFEKVQKTYTQGTNLDGEVSSALVDYLGNPVPQMTVYLFVGKKGSPFVVDTLTTNHKGIANLSLETEDFRGEMHLYKHFLNNTINALFTLSEIQAEFSFSLTVRTGYAPSIQVVAYTVLECERVLAHSERFYTEDCFSNPVSGPTCLLAIAAKHTDLGGPNYWHLVCFLLFLCISGVAKIYGYLPIKKPEPLPSELVDEPECVEVKPRTSYLAFTNQEKEDANTVFTTQGLQLLTNLPIQNPTCLKLGGKNYHEGFYFLTEPFELSSCQYSERQALERRPIPDPGRLSYTCYDELEPVYKLSTETWLFGLVKVGETGKTCVPYAVPNIVTTWNTEVFCVSPHAFGLAHPVLLSVFKPFSLDFKLPYFMIWGESLELKSIVHNYLPTPLKIKITAAASSSYILTPLSTDQSTFCLCAGEHKLTFLSGDLTVSLTAEAVSSQTSCCDKEVTVPESGHSIVVTRPLKVKVEIMCFDNNKKKSRCRNIYVLLSKAYGLINVIKETHIPDNVISGCLKAKVSVSGNILSRSVENLGDLLYLPYGCGEQNIAFMAIDTYILHYLQKTNKLSQETEKKGINYLITGYQRQLAYRKKTGAFSTFEKGEENTWLTAFVMVTFYKVQSFIYIDPKIIEEARKWLDCQQRDNGCFKVSGKLYNNYIRGDVSDEVTVTAYVTAALLETNVPNPVVKKSLSCLKDYIYDFSNTYTTALLAYVFTLAGNREARSKLLHYLDSVAIKEGDLQHWCLTPKQNPCPLCVEITSYVLLAKVGDSLSEGDLSCSSNIIRWLIKQQSYYGGFESTQDTAVAIKAMTLYNAKVLNQEGSTSVTVSSPTDHLSFQVNQNNKLVHQELMLQDLKGKYWLRAEGTSCSVVQVSDWNSRSSTNMVVLDIAVPSGFWPVPASLWNVSNSLINFAYTPTHDYDLNFLEMIQEYEVQHLRPSTVTIYDYYCPSKTAQFSVQQIKRLQI
uniref:NTR domain-containing protein n=1 Tax=Xiphophorus maculatus TaxID=8083 RepID=A0A3B5R761_XIPMA